MLVYEQLCGAKIILRSYSFLVVPTSYPDLFLLCLCKILRNRKTSIHCSLCSYVISEENEKIQCNSAIGQLPSSLSLRAVAWWDGNAVTYCELVTWTHLEIRVDWFYLSHLIVNISGPILFVIELSMRTLVSKMKI